MEKVLFENQECYVAYKAFNNIDELLNYQGNYVYELNHWYESLDVDISDLNCSYGCNLTQTVYGALEYGQYIYKCYVPIKNNIIHLLNNQDKFRTKRFYLSNELIDLNKFFEELNWDELNEYQKDLICEYNKNFDYDFYWDKLNEYQKDLLKTRVIIKL